MANTEWAVHAADAGARLDKFLAAPERLGSRARATAALRRGKVFVNGVEAPDDAAGTRLGNGDIVRVWMDRPGSARRRPALGEARNLRILYEDDALLVMNKPAGLLVVPLERRSDAPSVYEAIKDHLRTHGRRRPFVVHRIDRDTSGLVVFAKRADAQAWRDYLTWDQDAMIQIETSPRDPRGKEATSEYRVIETFAKASLIEVRLVTGKRNQIRLQARLRGHMLVGEQRYVFGPEHLRSIKFPRQALHAFRLSFRHPMDGREMQFEAPMPEDLTGLLARLRGREPVSASAITGSQKLKKAPDPQRRPSH
jgi:23S rRNA pseudouridine1911/1915/1917 synthase